jgi:hypothetical protein
MLRVTKVLPALLMLVPIQGLTAQGSAIPLRLEGEKVRVRVATDTAEASRRSFGVSGTVVGQHGDTIQVVESKGRLWQLPVSSVESIEISRGRDRWVGSGLGAFAGVAVGLLLSMTPPDCDGEGYGIDCRPDGTTPSTVQYVTSNLGMTTLLGAIVGAVVGAVVGVERWERIMARPRLSVAPAGGGIGLRVSY